MTIALVPNTPNTEAQNRLATAWSKYEEARDFGTPIEVADALVEFWAQVAETSGVETTP